MQGSDIVKLRDKIDTAFKAKQGEALCTIQKTAFKKAQNCLMLFLVCEKISPLIYFDIKNILEENIKGKCSFSVSISAPEGEEGKAFVLKEIARIKLPFIYPFIKDSLIEEKDSGILIKVAYECAVDIIGASKFASYTEEYYSSLGKAPKAVKVLFDGQIPKYTKEDLKQVNEEKETVAAEKAPAEEFKPLKAKELKPAKTEKKFNPIKLDKKSEVICGKKIVAVPIKVYEITDMSGNVTVSGKMIYNETIELKDGKRAIFKFGIYDKTSTINCTYFTTRERLNQIKDLLKTDNYYLVQGQARYDTYNKETCIGVSNINKSEFLGRVDNAGEKRVELHLHTMMSAQDATIKTKDAVNCAVNWGMNAIAITDHGVVQSFPDAENAANGKIKIIYGMEGYLFDDTKEIFSGKNELGFDSEYVVFDIETTGTNYNEDAITEIGAVRVKDGEILDTFSSFVNPKRPIPPFIVSLTGITDEMVKDAPEDAEVLSEFKKFVGDACLVAHNSDFDSGFVFNHGAKYGINFDNDVLDTLPLSRKLYRELNSHSLNKVAEYLDIPLKHHRALNDAECTAKILLNMFARLEEIGLTNVGALNELKFGDDKSKGTHVNHVIILCKNKEGLKNLYKLVSESHLDYFYRRPRIPKSHLKKMRKGLIIGSACEQGELFRAALNGADKKTMHSLAEFYDYYELQPKGNNMFLLRNGTLKNEKELEDIYFKIYELGKKYKKPVVATSDAHFLNPEDEVFRRIIMDKRGFEDADIQPPLYLRRTQEMLDDFSFMGEEVAKEIVVSNTQKIAGQVESFNLLPKEPAMPKIAGAEDFIKDLAYKTVKSIYGEDLPDIVAKRLDRELHSIITNGFAVLYYIAHKLVKKSLDDGYLVGSRGSVGSSFAAFAMGITEVNPLQPHYICRNCKHSDFDIDIEKYECGKDLPHKKCPICGNDYDTDGFNIPFEVFLGINADKVPDIDLNFSGDYQPVAHKFTEELFGEKYIYRAGTISAVMDKIAYGYVRDYMEAKGENYSSAEIKRLINGISGTKKTTGQHPGGLVVVPQDKEIYDFTPVQRPANDVTSDTTTTHLDFNSLHDTLVKLDILGHDDPTMLKMLKDLTGIKPKSIPLNDEATMSIFSSTDALDVVPEQILGCKTGSIAIPEFGTRFVRQMLCDTMPKTMSELIRISGLSHGTDVWLNNAHDLILNKVATLSNVICTRDDIMNYLVSCGVEPRTAFFTMENVRKGKGLTDEQEQAMREKNVPNWFIDSCKKIKYMFPKAHASAYVIMAFRIAYYKVHCKREFYAAYFTVRADNFSADMISGGENGVIAKIRRLENMGNLNAMQKSQLTILEVIQELYERGLGFLPVDLKKSKAKEFIIEGDYLRLPFISIENLGENAANNIIKAREEAEFISIEDLRQRAKMTSASIEKMHKYGCLIDMPEENQLSFF
ncbi:MAG: PolC-type DNA polymerase III [Eubacteriales bacterium]